ncbi:MAG: carboxypeptidase regulatory-like domain-containing protein, partial [Bryobacteraceae bacterium]
MALTKACLSLCVLGAIALAQPSGTGVISGTVVEASSGDPVRKAVVTATWHGTPRSWATTRTDSSGRFIFESLPPGNYDLRATKTGLGTAIYGADSVRELGDFITLADGETHSGVKLRFLRSGSISGRVFDPDGDPIPGVNVVLL